MHKTIFTLFGLISICSSLKVALLVGGKGKAIVGLMTSLTVYFSEIDIELITYTVRLEDEMFHYDDLQDPTIKNYIMIGHGTESSINTGSVNYRRLFLHLMTIKAQNIKLWTFGCMSDENLILNELHIAKEIYNEPTDINVAIMWTGEGNVINSPGYVEDGSPQEYWLNKIGLDRIKTGGVSRTPKSGNERSRNPITQLFSVYNVMRNSVSFKFEEIFVNIEYQLMLEKLKQNNGMLLESKFKLRRHKIKHKNIRTSLNKVIYKTSNE